MCHGTNTTGGTGEQSFDRRTELQQEHFCISLESDCEGEVDYSRFKVQVSPQATPKKIIQKLGEKDIEEIKISPQKISTECKRRQ